MTTASPSKLLAPSLGTDGLVGAGVELGQAGVAGAVGGAGLDACDPQGGMKTPGGCGENVDPLPSPEPSEPCPPAKRDPAPIGVLFPLPLGRGGNDRENPFQRSRRVHSEHEVTLWSLALAHLPQPALPCTVVLSRIAPGTLDDDNLVGAFKGVRDAVAKWLGVNDRRLDLVSWEYAQRKAARQVAFPDAHAMVEITFEAYRAPRHLQAA